MLDRKHIVDRFISYITIDTESDPNSNTTPSTKKQWDLANKLVKELKDIGMSDVSIDENAYAEADEMFHSMLIKLTENAPLDNIYFFSNIHDKVVGHGLVRTPEETLEEHFKIINAIEEGNPDKAEKLVREHINKSKELLINQLTNLGAKVTIENIICVRQELPAQPRTR